MFRKIWVEVTWDLFVKGTWMSPGKILTLKGEKISQTTLPQSLSPDSEGNVILSSPWSQSLRVLVLATTAWIPVSVIRKKEDSKKFERGYFSLKTSVRH